MVEHKLHKKFHEYQKSVLGIKRKLNRLTFIENNFRCNPKNGFKIIFLKISTLFGKFLKLKFFARFIHTRVEEMFSAQQKNQNCPLTNFCHQGSKTKKLFFPFS